MVLHGKPCGRVGRRRIFFEKPAPTGGLFLFQGSALSERPRRAAFALDFALLAAVTGVRMSSVMVGVIGGTGLGEALGGLGQGDLREIETPFGRPSGPITLTEIGGVPAALLSRHGEGHLLNPSQVPYRANIFALKALGVTHILASGAVGAACRDRTQHAKEPPLRGLFLEKSGGDLLSQGVSPQVPSALAGLTSVFGMGTGVTPPLKPPEIVKSDAARVPVSPS